MIVIYEDMGSVDFFTRDFMFIYSEIAGFSFITKMSLIGQR